MLHILGLEGGNGRHRQVYYNRIKLKWFVKLFFIKVHEVLGEAVPLVFTLIYLNKRHGNKFNRKKISYICKNVN